MSNELAELFERDPLSLSELDLDKIVAELREKRKQFNLGAKTAGKMKEAKGPKLDLSDLGL